MAGGTTGDKGLNPVGGPIFTDSRGIWGKDRSTPITPDLWINTTKNSTNPEIQIRAIFWGIFSEKILGENRGGGGEIREQPRALIPYDKG